MQQGCKPPHNRPDTRPVCCCLAGIRPEEIDILVTNCSIYCPTPSLASMLVNKFKLRRDIQSYHLGGMGCGNGVMALGLIKDLLQVGQAPIQLEAAGLCILMLIGMQAATHTGP